MRVDRFIDTNVLVYAFAAGDPRSGDAEAILAEGGTINVQVLNEFTHIARRKLHWSWPQVEAALAVFHELLEPARPLTTAVHARALTVARASNLSLFDALIVAAAQEAGCKKLYSEDLQHGQRFGIVTVEDPFRHRGLLR